MTGGQGVAGSNPAVPTGNNTFRYSYVSQEPTKEPTYCATALLETCADRVPRHPYGHMPTRQSRLRPTVNEPKITEPPHICTATPPTANRRPPSPARPLIAGRTLTGVPQLRDASRPGCSHQARPRRRRREAVGMTAAPRTGRHDRSDLHRHLDTGCILAMTKVPTGPAAASMRCTDK